MDVAGVEPERDAPSARFEHDVLRACRPLTCEPPLVQPDAIGRTASFASCVAEVGLRCAQVVPVGLGLDADAFHLDELALDAEQLLDAPFGLLVAPFAE